MYLNKPFTQLKVKREKIKIRILSTEETKSNKPALTLYNPLLCHLDEKQELIECNGQSLRDFMGVTELMGSGPTHIHRVTYSHPLPYTP